MNAQLPKPAVFDHAVVISSVIDDIIAGCPLRWKRGRPRCSDEEMKQHLKHLQKATTDLTHPTRHSFSRIFEYADGDIESFNEAVRLNLQETVFEEVPHVESKIREVHDNIRVVGSDRAENSTNNNLTVIEQQLERIRERLSGMQWQEIVQEVLKTKKSPIHQLLYKLGLNGKALRKANEFLNMETNLRCFNVAERLLRKALNPFSQNGHGDQPRYQLAHDSELQLKLEEFYISEALEDEQIAKASLARHVEESLGEIIVELFTSDRQNTTFDFDTTQEALNARGIFISSKFSEVLSVIPRRLHIDPGYVKIQHSNDPVTKLFLFTVVSSITHVPQLSNMMDMIEERAQTDEDRRLFVTDIRSLFPQRYRETAGVSLDEAAAILLKAFLTPDAVELYRTRTQHVDMLYPAPIGRKSYNTVEGVAETITFGEEKAVHDRFWLYYCENRSAVINQLDNFQCGRYGTGEQAQRFAAAKSFVGATRWTNAIETLLDQTRNADLYYGS